MGKAPANVPWVEKGNLKPNVQYESGEFGYKMETDSSGRLVGGSTDNLQFTERTERLGHNSNTSGKQSGDHAGHIFGDRFGVSP